MFESLLSIPLSSFFFLKDIELYVDSLLFSVLLRPYSIFLWVSIVSDEKSALIFVVLLYVICHFCLAAFKIFVCTFGSQKSDYDVSRFAELLGPLIGDFHQI